MPSYLVKEPLLHDGKPYAPDSEIELEAKAASDLVRKGVIEPVKTKTEAKPGPQDSGKGKGGK